MPSIQTLFRDRLGECRVYADRHILIDKHLPKNAVVAELGVHEGEFARTIYDLTKPKKLFLIDYWPSDNAYDKVVTKFGLNNPTVTLMPDFIETALPGFEDNFFDWVYLDACHKEGPTLDALRLLDKKVKNDGFIAGHDFCNGSVSSKTWFGVVPAVYQFVAQSDWRLSALALDYYGHFSFALKKE